MAEQVTVVAFPRPGTGKGAARQLRRNGRVPAVAYGGDLESTPISVDALDLYHALHTDAGLNAIIRLEIDGSSHLTLAREIQRHPVRRQITHVDFVMIDQYRKVTVDVPVALTGESPGVAEGGVADQALFAVRIEVLPLEVPDQFQLDISDMQIGDVKRLTDLDLPPDVDLHDDPERAVVSISAPTVEEEPEAAEEEVEEPEGAIAEPAGEEEATEESGSGEEGA